MAAVVRCLASAHSLLCHQFILFLVNEAASFCPCTINADKTVAEYLSAGAALGGAGNTFLATEEEIQEKNWAAVQAKASAFVDAVNDWKAANPSSSL